MLALMVLAAVWVLRGAVAGQPFIIHDPTSTWGAHVQAHGWALAPSDAYMNITVASICKCNVACQTDLRCVAASFDTDKMTCHLADSGPHDTTVTRLNGSHYIYKLDTLEAKVYGVKEDGLLYLRGTRRRGFVGAVAWCDSTPGFRLAMTKKVVQYNTVTSMQLEFNRAFRIDLEVVGQDILWGDGTRYEDTAIASVAKMRRRRPQPSGMAFVVYSGELRESSQDNGNFPLCQANPNGIEW